LGKRGGPATGFKEALSTAEEGGVCFASTQERLPGKKNVVADSFFRRKGGRQAGVSQPERREKESHHRKGKRNDRTVFFSMGEKEKKRERYPRKIIHPEGGLNPEKKKLRTLHGIPLPLSWGGKGGRSKVFAVHGESIREGGGRRRVAEIVEVSGKGKALSCQNTSFRSRGGERGERAVDAFRLELVAEEKGVSTF